jgi:hypothetical protein
MNAVRVLLLLFLGVALALGNPDDDWARIVLMDSGPTAKPANVEEARAFARNHFARHKMLLDDFLSKYPEDARAFDAKIRIAAILAASGKMDGKQTRVDDAMRMLQSLENEKSAPVEKRSEAGFRRVSLLLQSLQGQEIERRRDIVAAARNFQARYPGDRRVPRLLAEVATICDSDPDLKHKLLSDARRLSKEETLNRRIDDDLKRLSLLDTKPSVRFPTVQNGTFDLAAQSGRIVILIFWSSESAPSILWIEELRRAMAKLPADKISIATFSLDRDIKSVRERCADIGIANWPTGCDGLGWQSPLARAFGINALPTVFIFDQNGTLRSINARSSYESWIRRLLLTSSR